VSTGRPNAPTIGEGGWAMLCNGPCDLTGCANVLDFVALSGSTAPAGAPACASFTPAPIDATAAVAGDSVTRTGMSAAGAQGQAGDWSLLPESRD
jgi:hypothetical protein